MVAGLALSAPRSEDHLVKTEPVFEITQYSIDSGGANSVGGEFSITGTIAQHDVGTQIGGSYLLSGGFWWGSSKIFVDDFESGDDSRWSNVTP